MKKGERNESKAIRGAGAAKAAAFCKRYWYWFAVLTVLIVGVILWCYFMGFFAKKTVITAADEINLFVGMRYNLNATSSSDEVRYTMDEKFQSYFSIEGKSLYGKKEGSGYVTLVAGNAKKRVYVTVHTASIEWRVGVGDTIPEELPQSIANGLRDGGNASTISDYRLLERVTEGEEDFYRAEEAGICYLTYETEEGLTICTFVIHIEEDLDPSKRDLHENVDFLTENAKNVLAEQKNLRGDVITQEIGEEGNVPSYEFGCEGNVYYYSSAPDVVCVHQDGSYDVLFPGTAYVSVTCLDPAGGWEYYTVKFSVPAFETPVYYRLDDEGNGRPYRVGETVLIEDMRALFDHVSLTEFRSEYGAYLEENGDGTGFVCKQETEERTVRIGGYDATGKLLVWYTVTISDEEEAH